MNDTEKGSKQAMDEAKTMALKKQQLLKKIDDYSAKILLKDVLMKKIEDDLLVYKQQKHFLDILAIQAGKKKYQPKQSLNESSQANLNELENP